MQMELVTDFTLVLIAALAGGFLAQRLGQPLIAGYPSTEQPERLA
jgi:Kef-type K+ transport system membrane component KefB